jgi:CBS domain-containing protein
MSPRAAWRLEAMGFGEVYDYAPGKLDWLQAGLPSEGTMAGEPRVGPIARPDVPTCSLDERVGEVRERVREAGWDACVVVNEERVVLGLLRRKELEGDAEASIEDAMRPGPSTFRANVPIDEMAHFMSDHDLESAPITSPQGELLGYLFRTDAERAAHGVDEGGAKGEDGRRTDDDRDGGDRDDG